MWKVKATYVTKHQFFTQCSEASGLTWISLHYLWGNSEVTGERDERETKKKYRELFAVVVNSISRMMRTGLASKYQSSCVSFGFFHHKKSRVVVNSISFGFRTHTHAYLHFHCALVRNFIPKLPAIFNHLIISHKTLLAYANMGTGYETSFFTALQISRERRLQFLVI